MKKLLKENIKLFIAVIITGIVTSVTSILAYSLIAENVGYIPHDNNWYVENVDAALNDLNLRTKDLSSTYSSEETVVGNWIDGKKVYQKTFYINQTVTDKDNSIPGLNVIDTVVNIKGTAKTPKGTYETNTRVFYTLSSSDVNGPLGLSIQIKPDINSIRIIKRGSVAVAKANDFYITLQYTKTTD